MIHVNVISYFLNMMLSTCTYSKVKTNTSSYKNKISIAYHVIFNIYHNILFFVCVHVSSV